MVGGRSVYTKGTLPVLVSWDNSITAQVAVETP
jgi:hypothetical protein